MMRSFRWGLLALMTACHASEPVAQASAASLALTSPAFQDGGQIPAKYSCDGAQPTPPLAWTGVPAAAKALALVVLDPDAPSPPFTHWLAYNLPPATTSLAEGGPLPEGTLEGKNGAGKAGWMGPCPPSGNHRYVFTLYALDAPLALEAGASKDAVQQAIAGHVLAQGTLTGKYRHGG